VVFIKTKMILLLKFHKKLNRMPCQHQSNCTTCPLINFFVKKNIKNIKKLFFLKKKIKNFGTATPWPFGGGRNHPQWVNLLLDKTVLTFLLLLISQWGVSLKKQLERRGEKEA
jgi:hypothetical protein